MAIGVAELGRRITDARRDLGLARQECASRARMGRTVLAKIETGARQVGAMELARLADALDMRIEWFFEEAPPAVVSRRSAAEAGVPSSEIDRRVERVAREVTFLQGIVGSLDLLAFSLDLDADTADGASITGVRTTVIRRADLVERDLFVPTEPDPPELPDVYVEAVLDAYRSVRRYRQPEPSRSCSRPGMRTTSPSCRCFRRTLSGRLCPDRLRTDTLVFDTGPLSCFARADIRGGGCTSTRESRRCLTPIGWSTVRSLQLQRQKPSRGSRDAWCRVIGMSEKPLSWRLPRQYPHERLSTIGLHARSQGPRVSTMSFFVARRGVSRIRGERQCGHRHA